MHAQGQYERRKLSAHCGRCGHLLDGSVSFVHCNSCRQYLKKYHKQKYKLLTQSQIEKRRACVKKWKAKNPDRVQAMHQKRRTKMRSDIFTHYGNKCICCGTETFEFLTIDHKNGGGNSHRRNLFKGKMVSGIVFYQKMKKIGYPDYLQILCWNCNMAKAHFGKCPHQP